MVGSGYGLNVFRPIAVAGSNAHDGSGSNQLFSLYGMFGLGKRMNVLAVLPYSLWRQSADIEDLHHRNESMRGMRDVHLGLRYIAANTIFGPGTRIFLGVSVTLPTAPSYTLNPFAAAADTTMHRHFALGNGTPTATLDGEWWLRTESAWIAGLLVRFRPRLARSPQGFEPGARLNIDLQAVGQAYRWWRGFPYLVLRLRWEDSDYWEGTAATNSGGYFLEGSAGLNFEISETYSAVFRYTFPIISRLSGSQQLAQGLEIALRFIRL